MLISDIPAFGALAFDVATTSVFHIEEVERVLSARGVRVAAVNAFPESDALLAMALDDLASWAVQSIRSDIPIVCRAEAPV